MTLLFFAILPILWLILALSGLKMAAWKACPGALLLSLLASVIFLGISVSSDYRVRILLIALGFGGFLEGMAGFGTAVAIPASMLAGMGINPVSAVAVCLVANFVPSAYGSIGIPLVTLSGIMGTDPVQLATYVALQIGILGRWFVPS